MPPRRECATLVPRTLRNVTGAKTPAASTGDRSLRGPPRVRLSSTFRTAGCGPACPVMWQGSSGAPCGPISVTFLLWKIEQQNLSVFGRSQFQLLLVDDFRAVTFCEIDSIEAYLSAGHVYVCLPAFLDFLLNQFSATDRADIQLDILIDGQCVVAAFRRRNQTQLPPGTIADRLLLISWFQPAPARNDPDLQEMQRRRRRWIELAIHDSGSCRHPLHVASRNDPSASDAPPPVHLPLTALSLSPPFPPPFPPQPPS